MARFAAPWDRALRVTSALVSLVLCGTVVGIAILVARTDGPVWIPVGLAVIIGAFVLGTWLLAPRGFTVERGELRVERPLRPVVIPLGAVRSAGLVPKDGLRGTLRVAGSSGLFGYFGQFWSIALGAYRMYATRRDGLVRVDTGTERFVLSPETPERFLSEVLARAPAAGGEPGAPLPRRKMRRGVVILLVVLVAVGPVGAVTAVILLGAYTPVGARVTNEAVLVDRTWAGPAEIPVASIRAVGVLSPAAFRGFQRIAGSSTGAVHYGKYRSDPLGDFQLYAWRRGHSVLLETADGQVVLTPEEPERFVAEVKRAVVARGGTLLPFRAR